MRFVEFECGCIGFPPDNYGNAVILKPCAEDSFGCDKFIFKNRPTNGKSFTECSENDTKLIFYAIETRLHLGHNLIKIRCLLEY